MDVLKCKKYDTINNSPLLSKINYKFYNLKIINLICKKMDICTNNFQQFTQYIYNVYIYDIYEPDHKNEINAYLSKYLDFTDIDKCIKLSYLYIDEKLLYTSKMKKKIEKTFQLI